MSRFESTELINVPARLAANQISLFCMQYLTFLAVYD